MILRFSYWKIAILKLPFSCVSINLSSQLNWPTFSYFGVFCFKQLFIFTFLYYTFMFNAGSHCHQSPLCGPIVWPGPTESCTRSHVSPTISCITWVLVWDNYQHLTLNIVLLSSVKCCCTCVNCELVVITLNFSLLVSLSLRFSIALTWNVVNYF